MNGPQEDDMLPEERALMEGNPMPGEEAPADQSAPTEQEVKEPVAAEAPPAAAAAPAEATPTAEESTAAPLTDEDGDPVLIPVPQAVDFSAERTKLEEREAEVERKWASGEVSDEDRLKEIREIRKADRELTKQEVRQEIPHLHNEAAIRSAQHQLIAKLKDASKAAGEIDYDKPAAQAAFDAQLNHLMATEFKDKDMTSWANVRAAYNKAHADLCAAFGVKKPAAPAPTPPKQEEKAAKPEIPPSLGRFPAADRAPLQNDFLTSLTGTDDPDAAEAMVAAQPKGVREAVLRAATPTRRH